MDFIEDARRYFETQALPSLNDGLTDYVNRQIVREGEDVDGALFFLRKRERDPEKRSVIEDTELNEIPFLFLLGDAGTGKSSVVDFTYAQAVRQFISDPQVPAPFYLDLESGLSTDLSIVAAFQWQHEGLFYRALTEHPAGVRLYFDGLDEVLRKDHLFINNLKAFVGEYQSHMRGLLVACRRSYWQKSWTKEFHLEMTEYHTDYLGSEVYKKILSDNSLRDKFFERCHVLGITDLLNTPFDGFFLARYFQRKYDLPATRRECIRIQVKEKLQNKTKSEAESGKAPSLDRLRFLAGQLACIASFTEHTSWTFDAATDLLGQSSSLQQVQPVSSEEVHWLLRRPLFKCSAGRFTFDHQLYREYLAAEALENLSLRKQRQLLEAIPSRYRRIQTQHRGIAIFLAERLEAFRQYLIEEDPVVAFLAEVPAMNPEEKERLLQVVIGRAIERQEPPWLKIPPRGERLDDRLSKYNPRNVEAFLRPYLESEDEIARIWGCTCAAAWGGAKMLNELLNELAHGVEQHREIRTHAIEAIVATKDPTAIRKLYDLFEDQDDPVRGRVLQAYRELESPSPSDYIGKILSGERNPNLLCRLQIEVRRYGGTLDRQSLAEAFTDAEESLDKFRDPSNDDEPWKHNHLRSLFLEGLFAKAEEIGFDSISPTLIVKLHSDERIGSEIHNYEELVIRLLTASTTLWRNVLSYALERLSQEDDWKILHYIHPLLLKSWSDDRLNRVPTNWEELNQYQRRFVENLVSRVFQQNPTKQRLQRFQKRFPSFVVDRHSTTKNRPLRKQRSIDPLDVKQRLLGVLRNDGINVVSKISQFRYLASIITERYDLQPTWPNELSASTTEEVQELLDLLPASGRKQILDFFRDAVSQVRYFIRKEKDGRHTGTHDWLRLPFDILLARGEKFPPKKIAEIVQRYGHLSEDVIFKRLLPELAQRDREVWEQSIFELLDGDFPNVDSTVKYLIDKGEGIYLARCSERLESGDFERGELRPLIDYLLAFKPDGYVDTLRKCYDLLCRAKVRDLSSDDASESALVKAGPGEDEMRLKLESFDQWIDFVPLIELMNENDEWAWNEFGKRLDAEDVPIYERSIQPLRLGDIPQSPAHLSCLVKWYVLIRNKNQDEEIDHLAIHVMDNIVRIGGDEVIKELRRVQAEEAFPHARWLSHTIARIEDQMLGEHAIFRQPGPLLDFVNKPRFHIIQNERDLFESVCEALEEVKQALEKRGEGVAGFWNGDDPKVEEECQNVLWPFMRSKLGEYGVVDVEERYVGKNKSDFAVRYPRSGGGIIEVIVELKTARKGYGSRNLLDPVESQLWEKYMYPTGCSHGLFVVLWFRDGKRYDYPKRWKNRDEFAGGLENSCKAVTLANGVTIAPYVVDMTTPYRSR